MALTSIQDGHFAARALDCAESVKSLNLLQKIVHESPFHIATKSSPAFAAGPRNQLIDVLRGISIFAVMAMHGAAPIPPRLLDVPQVKLSEQNGLYGVTIFFVISGFLISSNVLKRYIKLSRVLIDEFYVMRVARILPCLALFVVVYFILFKLRITGFVPSPEGLFYRAVSSLAQLQYGYFYLRGGNVEGLYPFAPLWSICVEETFYLIFPIMCFLLRSDAVVLSLAVLFVILGPSFRSDYGDLVTFWGSVDMLSMGCIAAKVTDSLKDRMIPRWSSLLLIGFGSAILILCFTTLPNRVDFKWAWSALGVGTAMILTGASLGPAVPKGWPSGLLLPLSFLGSMSLQLYMFHLVFAKGLRGFLNEYVIFGLLVAFAWVLGKFFLDPVDDMIRGTYRQLRPRRLSAASEPRGD